MRIVAWALWVCLLCATPAFSEIPVSELPARAQALAARVASGARPPALAAAAEEFGQLVDRARAANARAPAVDRLLSAGVALADAIERERDRLEDATGDREDALEALYASDDWRRLDYAAVLHRYWTGWAEIRRGEVSEGAARKKAFQRAERAFSRTSLEVSLPRVATLSLLGAAIARRELGATARARQALERFEAQVTRSGDAELLAPALLEATRLALDEGDLERADALFARIPADRIGTEQRMGFEQLRTEALLAAAKKGDPGAAARAATSLRKLLAAGGDYARAAVAMAMTHREQLAAADLGTLGAWLAAEDAYADGRYADARDRYAALLGEGNAPPGLDRNVARYKFAAAVSQAGGNRAAALAALDALLAGDQGGELRQPAARMAFALAALEHDAKRDANSEARLSREARRLLAVDPGAPAADQARVIVARSGKGDSLALLDAVAPESPTFGNALAERVRLRGVRLQRRENRGRRPDASEARRLLADLDTLVARERAPDPTRDRQLRLLAAKASQWSGAPVDRVLARVAAAEVPGQSASQSRALLRVRLAALAGARRFDAALAEFARATDRDVRRDYAVWSEAARRLAAAGLPARRREPLWARLARNAPDASEASARLEWAKTLHATGDSAGAVREADLLLAADPTWGDPALLRARALTGLPDHAASVEAWGAVVSGVEPGEPLWAEALLEMAAAARRADDEKAACLPVAALRAPEWADAPWMKKVEERLAELEVGCPGS